MTTKTDFYWSYEENVTAEEFIRRLQRLVCEPVQTMQECDGDILLSQYRDLCEGSDRIKNAVSVLDKNSGDAT